MIAKLKGIYKKAQFEPTFVSLLINPFFIIRRGLFRGIMQYKHYMKGKLLDFGCGSKPYINLFQVSEYIGTDIAVSGHDHHNEHIDVYYDGKTLPFDENTFDSILCSEVFEHLFNLEDILKELYRVLKPGGYMLVTVPFVWDEHEVPYDFGRYSSFGIKHLMEKHGFKMEAYHKSTTYFQTIIQMRNAYIYQHIFPKRKIFKLILNPLIIFPLTLWGLFWNMILPKSRGFFHNSIYVVTKES
jgi:SAM-dependent methyltransferase